MEASALHAPQRLGRFTVRGSVLRLRTDDQLVALFRMGYDDAFQTIFDRYRVRLYAYTRQMLGGSRSDAEDALQDVFLRAYSALRCDDRPVTLRAWLYRVAHNRCVDQLRRPIPAPADVFDLSRPPLRDPLAECERREDLRRLVADVGRLPEQQRSALLMRELEGLTYQELADALAVTLPAVKSLLVRARVGLVDAGEARDTACVEIRNDLLDAHDRGVRCDARARRHLRDCGGCREYHSALRGTRTRKRLAALGYGGPLATFAKLLGIGGAGSGAAAGASAGGAAGGGVVAGSVAAGTATKVAAVICCAAVVGGGAAEVGQNLERHHAPATRSHPARARVHPTSVGQARQHPATAAPAQSVILRRAAAVTVAPARPKAAAAHRRASAHRTSGIARAGAHLALRVDVSHGGTVATYAMPTQAERASGGAGSPDEQTLVLQNARAGTGAQAPAAPQAEKSVPQPGATGASPQTGATTAPAVTESGSGSTSSGSSGSAASTGGATQPLAPGQPSHAAAVPPSSGGATAAPAG